MPKGKDQLPKVTIIGRPNVGKSSLFNRIAKCRKAIVYQEVGTTRDRVNQEVTVQDKRFVLIDTGGFALEDKDEIFKLIKGQIKKAIDESDVLLFVCDGQAGIHAQDFELAALLRKTNKRIFLAINKVDNEKIEKQLLDFYELGFDESYPVSAIHNIGITKLVEDLVEGFPESACQDEKTEAIKVAIIGRPNVGKSSFVNYLLKEERVIVNETPGTTRDTVDTYLREDETDFILIDTAGLRHKKKVKEPIDVYSMMRTKEAIERSQICLVLIDGYDGLRGDDLKILDLVLKEGKCCILCVNKWDLVKEIPMTEYTSMIYNRLDFLRKYPILFTSVKTGYNIYSSLALIKEIIANSHIKIPTHQLNKLLKTVKSSGPFAFRGNVTKLYYITQTRTAPPRFVIFVNKPELIPEQNKNFIENLFRKNFSFFGTPLRFEFRSSRETKGRSK